MRGSCMPLWRWCSLVPASKRGRRRGDRTEVTRQVPAGSRGAGGREKQARALRGHGQTRSRAHMRVVSAIARLHGIGSAAPGAAHALALECRLLALGERALRRACAKQLGVWLAQGSCRDLWKVEEQAGHLGGAGCQEAHCVGGILRCQNGGRCGRRCEHSQSLVFLIQFCKVTSGRDCMCFQQHV